MISKAVLVFVSLIGMTHSRFSLFDPTTYADGAYNLVTGNAHAFDT